MRHTTNIIIISILCICTFGYVLGATIQSLASNTGIDTAGSTNGPKLEKRQPTRFFPSRLHQARLHEIQNLQLMADDRVQKLEEQAREALHAKRQAWQTENVREADLASSAARDAEFIAIQLVRLVTISRSDSRSRTDRNDAEETLSRVYNDSTEVLGRAVQATDDAWRVSGRPRVPDQWANYRRIQERMNRGEDLIGPRISHVVETGRFLANAQPHGHPQPGSPGSAYERLLSRFIDRITSTYRNRDSPRQHQIWDFFRRMRRDSQEVDQIAATGNEYQHRHDDVPPPSYSEEPRGQHYYYGDDPPPLYDSRHHRRRDPQVSIIPDHQLAEFVDIVRQAWKAIVEADSYEYDLQQQQQQQQQKNNIPSSSGSDSSEKKPDDISGLYPEMLSNLLDLATMVEVFIQVPGLSLSVPA